MDRFSWWSVSRGFQSWFLYYGVGLLYTSPTPHSWWSSFHHQPCFLLRCRLPVLVSAVGAVRGADAAEWRWVDEWALSVQHYGHGQRRSNLMPWDREPAIDTKLIWTGGKKTRLITQVIWIAGVWLSLFDSDRRMCPLHTPLMLHQGNYTKSIPCIITFEVQYLSQIRKRAWKHAVLLTLQADSSSDISAMPYFYTQSCNMAVYKLQCNIPVEQKCTECSIWHHLNLTAHYSSQESLILTTLYWAYPRGQG